MSGERILLVEDEGIVAKDMELRLRALNYVVCGWVTSGEEALASVHERRPDLVLMDIHLSGPMDGIQAAHAIWAVMNIPVVFLTAYADEETVSRAKATHPFGFIVKPFEERDLRATLELAFYKHKMERLLRDREQWLSTTLSSIADGIITTGDTGRITYLNPVAEALTGWFSQEAVGRRMEEVFTVEGEAGIESAAVPSELDQSCASPEPVTRRGILRSQTGASVPVEFRAAPIRTDGDGSAGEVVVVRDVSERREAEARLTSLLHDLQRSNADLSDQKGFLAALFDANPSAIMVVDEHFRVQMANGALQRAFGTPGGKRDAPALPGDLLHCPYSRRESGDCGAREECQVCQLRLPILGALAGQEVSRRRAELVLLDRGKPRAMVFLVSAAPFEFKGTKMALVVLEDVTELSSLRSILKAEQDFAGIVGRDPRMLELYETIRELAPTGTSVLIQGESGTGKELVARALHSEGYRAGGPFVAVNCGALPDGLIESELFGHQKGSFTGAVRDKKGRFELADGGTVFLDEVGDLGHSVQVKLLRVLETRSFERVGGERAITADVRVVSATHKDLMAEVRAGRFREDLYYRLCVVPLHLPPLRDRVNDIPLLAGHLLAKQCALSGRPRADVSPEALGILMDWPWPGNVRELQNALEYALIKCKEGPIRPEHLPPSVCKGRPRVTAAKSAPGRKRKWLTRAAVDKALSLAGGNKLKAIKILGVSRATLYRFLEKEGRAAN